MAADVAHLFDTRCYRLSHDCFSEVRRAPWLLNACFLPSLPFHRVENRATVSDRDLAPLYRNVHVEEWDYSRYTLWNDKGVNRS